MEKALDSLLAQTETDIEIILIDNASTDTTPSICRRYANRDSRIRYVRNPLNTGGFANHRATFQLSRGKYFTWAGHDDVRDPTHIERCLDVLVSQPEVVLCYSGTLRIDENDMVTTEPDRLFDLTMSSPAARFLHFSRLNYRVDPIYGLIRREVLALSGLVGDYADSDRVLLAELSLYGPFQKVPDALFFRREHPERSVTLHKSRQSRAAWVLPGQPLQITFPYLRQWRELCRVLQRAKISGWEKLACAVGLAWWVVRYRSQVVRDLHYACRQKWWRER